MLEVCGGSAITDRGLEKDVSIAVEKDRIVDVGKSAELRKRYKFSDSIGGPEFVISPSFIDTHMHSYQAGTKGLTSDKSLLDWLKRYIWKWEAGLGKEQAKACAELSYLEMLKGGVTTFLDYTSVRHAEEAFMVADWFGMRGFIGKTMMDRNCPDGLKEDTDESLRDAERLIRRFGRDPMSRLRPVIIPRFCITSSDDLLLGCKELSERYGVMISTHAHENRDELKADRKEHGVGAIRHLNNLGLLSRKTLLAHCVHLSQVDLEILIRTRTAVSHCPGSNMALASGIADIPAMLARKIPVGLGSDVGAYCNFSMFEQMRLSVLAQKIRTGDPGALAPSAAFRMASEGGAKALGEESVIGALAAGRKADLLLLDSRTCQLSPENDLVSQIVLSGEGAIVDTVMCDGKVLVQGGEILFGDERKIVGEAREVLRSASA